MSARFFVRGALISAVAAGAFAIANCGGGGGGGGGSTGVLYYPYETVYGEVCRTSEPTPGCTFYRDTGTRINVTEDPHYDRYRGGSDDMYWVVFDSTGRNATVYYPGTTTVYRRMSITEFAGYISGSYIGVGTTGLFWEDVRNGTYWWGVNGVLYSANQGESNYGRAINNKNAGSSSDTNLAAMASEANEEMIEVGAQKIMKDFGLKYEKAHAVASHLQNFAVLAEQTGEVTTKDMDQAISGVFGVSSFSKALAAFNQYRQSGDKSGMKEIVLESADALDLSPDQAQRFIKGMLGSAAKVGGFSDIDVLN